MYAWEWLQFAISKTVSHRMQCTKHDKLTANGTNELWTWPLSASALYVERNGGHILAGTHFARKSVVKGLLLTIILNPLNTWHDIVSPNEVLQAAWERGLICAVIIWLILLSIIVFTTYYTSGASWKSAESYEKATEANQRERGRERRKEWGRERETKKERATCSHIS